MENHERKKRIELLLERQKMKQKGNYGVLFNECIEVLGDGVTIYSDEKSKQLYNLFINQVPFTEWARIDWSKVDKYRLINDLYEVSDLLRHQDIEIYWSYGNLPVLKTKFENLLKAFDDLVAVSPDTFLYVPEKYVIEIYHEGEITIGCL